MRLLGFRSRKLMSSGGVRVRDECSHYSYSARRGGSRKRNTASVYPRNTHAIAQLCHSSSQDVVVLLDMAQM